MALLRKTSFFRLLRRVFLGLILLILFSYGALHTPWVQDYIATHLSRKLSVQGQQVEMKRLRGIWPFSLRVDQLYVSDAEGHWLKLEQASLQWKWKRNAIQVQSLMVERAEVYRIPDFPDMTVDASHVLNLGSLIEWDIAADTLHLEKLVLGSAFTGKEIQGTLKGNGKLSRQTGLQITLSLESDPLLVESKVSIPADQPAASVEFAVKLDALHELTGQASAQEGQWEIQSTLASPKPLKLLADIEARLTSFGVETEQWTHTLPEDLTHTFPLTLETHLQGTSGKIHSENNLTFPGGVISIPLRATLSTQEVVLNLHADIQDMQKTAILFGHRIEGNLHSQMKLKHQKGIWELGGNLKTTQVTWEGRPLGDAQFDLTGDTNHVTGRMRYEQKKGPLEQQASMEFDIRPLDSGWALTLEDVEMKVAPFVFKSKDALKISRKTDRFEIPEAALTLNGLPLLLKGHGTPDDLAVSLRVVEYKADALPEVEGLSLDGLVSGDLTLSGKWEAPVAELSCAFEHLSLLLEEADTQLQLSGEATGTWSATGLAFDARIQDNQGNKMKAKGGSSAGWSLSPLRLPNPEADFTAEVAGSLNLSILNRFPFLENQRLTGLVETNLTFQRTKGAGSFSGQMSLDEGAYDHFQLGSRFQNIHLLLQLEDDKLKLTEATGRTPGGGTLSAQGFWNIRPQAGEGSLNLNLRNARLLHLDTVQAAVSGNMTLKKTEDRQVNISGDLALENTVFDMDRLPRPVPEPVPFTVKGPSDLRPVRPAVEKTGLAHTGFQARGDVRLRIPSTLIVKGNNVYSSWKGDFRLGLRPDGLQLNGTLNPRRGTVTFFGRTFRFSKGNVHFNDTLGTSPILDLEAEYTREDVEAVLLITGKVEDPKFRLRSNPPLPQDEVLSRILFGKDMASITGLQALEVGLALRSMMDSSGSNWDLMGKARDFLNVDQLELRESGDAEGTAEIVAGRQINNRLYLEFNQSLKEPGSSILLEYEIRRNLSISTETGTHTLPGIGINWKRDY